MLKIPKSIRGPQFPSTNLTVLGLFQAELGKDGGWVTWGWPSAPHTDRRQFRDRLGELPSSIC